MAVVIFFVPAPAWTYVGPGAGLGMMGSLIAVAGAVLVALFGVVLFPIMLLRKRRKDRSPAAASQDVKKHD